MINIINIFNPISCTLDLTFNTGKQLICSIGRSSLTKETEVIYSDQNHRKAIHILREKLWKHFCINFTFEASLLN